MASPDAARHAAARAAELGIELEIISAGGLFEQRVADPYLHDVLKGLEPSPGVLFHSELLIHALRQVSSAGKYDCVATGHSATLRSGSLLADTTDQGQASLLAFACSSDTKDLDFPLGGFSDAQVLKLAQTLGLSPEPKHLSQIQHPAIANPSSWLDWAKHRLPPGFGQPGWVRETRQGSGLAEHHGIHEHPIGVPVEVALLDDGAAAGEAAHSERLYSIASEAETQTIWASPLGEYGHQAVLLTELRWLDAATPPAPTGTDVEVRRSDGHWVRAVAHLWAGAIGTGRLEFASPVGGVFNGSHLTLIRQGRIVGTARASIPFRNPLGAQK